MRIYIENHADGYWVCQGDDAEVIAGPFETYDEAETKLNELNPEGDDSFEENR